MGIGPTYVAWKATALPLSYARLASLADRGNSGESRIRTCEGIANRFTVCPLWPLGYLPTQAWDMELAVRIELTTIRLQGGSSTIELR